VVVEIDYTALKAEIARADALDESKYTEESWAAMKKVYDEAVALIDNAQTQAEVDAKTAELKAAIDALVEKTVVVEIDYTALKAEIARADALDESKYTEESWAAMKKVYDEAKALIDNAQTQAEVDAKTAELKAAIDALVEKTVVVEIDYSALKAQIERADALDESKYTEESWAAMRDVYEKAVALIDNAETQAEVDEMTAALKAAIDALVVKGTDVVLDYTELKAQIARADALNEDDYTADSWLEMIKAYDAAKALLNNAETQEEIDAAAKALKTAIDNLVKKEVIVKPTIDYSALLAQIARVDALNESDYTSDSWANMIAEYNVAKALLNNAETQEEVDAAAAKLKAAIDALVKVSGDINPPPTGDFALICVALILVALVPVVFVVLRKKRVIKLR
ncbi:MAG: FIVAR domain-containing protein, partial [Clostridia bacterium]|nr:FIVAR domain-containing protein [Clostridia bacterium]